MKLVAPEDVTTVWPRVAKWIEAAVKHGQGDENALDVLVALTRGIYALWTSEELAAVVQVLKFPRQSVCTLLYVGGDRLDACEAAFTFAKAWCRANNVQVIRTYGRAGWQKVLNMKRVGVILQVSV